MRVQGAEWLGRLGILVIHNDPVPEAEIWAMAPRGVTVHTARFDSPTRTGAEYTGSHWRAMLDEPDVAHGLDQLGQIGLDAVCLCFASSSFFGGREFDEKFTAEARGLAHDTPVFTAGQAISAALRASGVSRPLVMLPPWFTEPTFRATTRYLSEVGFQIAALRQFDLGTEWSEVPRHRIFDRGGRWTVRVEEVYRQARELFPAGADGVLIPGSGFRSAEAIEPLEEDLGVPVITCNQACLWYFLRTTGLSDPVSGFGQLFGRALSPAVTSNREETSREATTGRGSPERGRG
ncbi:MAG TPA: hypothetical protein VIL00_11995 [Pseudonocardiaceae bacterium]